MERCFGALLTIILLAAGCAATDPDPRSPQKAELANTLKEITTTDEERVPGKKTWQGWALEVPENPVLQANGDLSKQGATREALGGVAQDEAELGRERPFWRHSLVPSALFLASLLTVLFFAIRRTRRKLTR